MACPRDPRALLCSCADLLGCVVCRTNGVLHIMCDPENRGTVALAGIAGILAEFMVEYIVWLREPEIRTQEIPC